MKDESNYLLDDLLIAWHRWAKGWTGVAQYGASAMFTGFKSSRQWDGEDDIADASIHNNQMKSIDFHVGELSDVSRTAIGINARNLSTGKSVWSSARLPSDAGERAVLLAIARCELLLRLRGAGIV